MGQMLPMMMAVIAWPFPATDGADLALERPIKPQIMAATENGSPTTGMRLTTPR